MPRLVLVGFQNLTLNLKLFISKKTINPMQSRLFLRKMSQQVTAKIVNNAELMEKRITELRSKLEEVKRIKIEEKIRELTTENKTLAIRVEKARNELIRLETINGKKQYTIPGKTFLSPVTSSQSGPAETVATEPTAAPVKEKKEASKKKAPPAPTNDSNIDVRKLDFRIGKIVEINKHPDADSLYVEKIDCGERSPRTVVSGLVNYVPIEEMRDRIVMVLCNLKPVKMRGVASEAMVMCASTPEKVEVLIPPASAVPGDLITCEGYPREPEAQLNPKKKIFETCAPDLKTNDDKVACYKGSPLQITGKGPVVAATLKGVNVK